MSCPLGLLPVHPGLLGWAPYSQLQLTLLNSELWEVAWTPGMTFPSSFLQQQEDASSPLRQTIVGSGYDPQSQQAVR